MRLAELVDASHAVRGTASRREKVALIAGALSAMTPEEASAGAPMLAGELRQGTVGVGPAALREPPPAAAEPALGLAEVDAAVGRLAALGGAGSGAARRAELAALLGRATREEQRMLGALLLGELRHGALEGVVLDAVASASGAPPALVRRALMLDGRLGAVAALALAEGAPGLARVGLRVGVALRPMLAAPAADVGEALGRVCPAAVEWKLDGVRVQVHRSGGDVAVFTRGLEDVTDRVPEVREAALALPAREAVLDGEAIALRPDGRPHPFQVTAGRLGSRRGVAARRDALPLTAMLFDLLHLDGADLIDLPGEERHRALRDLTGPGPLVPRAVAHDATGAAAALADALAHGHEGVIVKALDAPYAAGRRGAGWLKVKPRHTFDLVILAAEWGHGRRQGLLSNLHLGARDEAGGLVMLGKTFKGLTDAMLAWQTERLLALERERRGGTVFVHPRLVAEIAIDGVQASTRYPGGVALRFARVLRHRPDKDAAEADTLASLLALHPVAPDGAG